MARQGINTGTSPNDGLGDSLLAGAIKINSNFSEIYNTFGDGTTLVAPSGIASGLTTTASVNTSGIITASSFVGDGSGIIGVTASGTGIIIKDSGSVVGTAGTIDFGDNITVSPASSGIVTVTASGNVAGPGSSTDNAVTRFNGTNGKLIQNSLVTIGDDGAIIAPQSGSIIPFYFDNQSSFPSASTYHGAIAHSHADGGMFYAHNGVWIQLANASDISIGSTSQWVTTNAGIHTLSKVGIGTTNPTSVLTVSGDVLVSGVVTATSFSGNASSATFATNSGIATNVSGGTASVTSLSVSGISTFGTVKISSGIVTATSGVITYYGDGSNLTGIAASFAGAASTITSEQILNWDTSYSWGDHSLAGYTTSLNLDDLSDVNVGAPTTGQVLKWSGSEWQASADLTTSGTGIGLSDLSVTINPAGINSLTYNNATGVFLFTPTSLVGYATEGYVTTQIGLNTFTGAASTITTTQISNWDTAYGWGDHASAGYLTDVNITAGSNITVLETSEGNFIITSTAAGTGAGTTWSTNSAGIHTTKNVGIGTALSSSALTVEGDGRFSGIVTASRFESASAGTPTIDSPNNLNINAVTVAISTDVTIGDELRVAGITTIGPGGIRVAGVITATSFVGSGANITGISTLNIVNYGVGLGGATESDTLQSVTDRGSITTQEITASNFRSNDTIGNGSDVGFAIKYYITSSGSSAYLFAGPGLVNTTNNPTLYLHRGFTYIFENSTGGAHPFAIRYSSGGTGYGSTYLSGSQSGTQVFTVPFDAPATLVYQCTIHSSMLGTFNIVT
jgi:hypothetical protein